jgi:M6 family metalloprotease-like protein
MLAVPTYCHADIAVQNACKLQAPRYVGLSVGFTSPKLYTTSVGTLKGSMVFVDFDDKPANDTTENLYNFFMPSASDWYSTSSYGRLKIEMQADKSKFYRMPRLSTKYKWDRNGTDQDKYIRDLVSIMGNTSNFTNSDVLYIVPTRAAEHISFSPTRMQPVVLKDGTTMRTAVTFGQDIHLKYGFKTLNHETGHTMGLPDLYPSDETKLARGAWVGGYDIMGLINGTSPDYFAMHKWKLGWLDDNQVDCVSQKGTSKHVITPLEVVGGVKAAAVKLSATKAFVVELRTTAAFNASCSVGLLGYVINTAGSNSNPNGAPIEVLDPHTTNKGCSPARGGKLTGAAVNFDMGEKVMEFSRYGIKVVIKGNKDGNYEIEINWDGKSGAVATSPWGGFGSSAGMEYEEDAEDSDS